MLPRKFDTTLAIKAIALSDALTNSEKRIAIAVLDHFNRVTGRCDPSQDTIAALLSVDRRTVVRAINKLVRVGYFTRVRHGGVRQCNLYRPSWHVFRKLEEQWKLKRRHHADRFRVQEMSPPMGQSCLIDRGAATPQTCKTNQFPLTSSAEPAPLQSTASDAPNLAKPTNGLQDFAEPLERRLGKDVFQAWFRDVAFVEIANGKVVLSAPSRFIKARIEQQYDHLVVEIVRRRDPSVLGVNVLLSERAKQ
ncbi:helix-turn-helix domain-containing protein [Bradyrhizobium erythrophlei]|uniref:Helix-turn-helix domain-containing protein n=1 Tax=Bradyrhizobium erythrophlei TaxID=1437360 RepID=A0A1H5D0C8_9BRAD|nr:helix-turn-helix domain-containing protein [Bradyrhizobium erythrophlei]SED72369.1 Helix-turn-helix domain-containing protein [Bradyrhizobium erythrophlei]